MLYLRDYGNSQRVKSGAIRKFKRTERDFSGGDGTVRI